MKKERPRSNQELRTRKDLLQAASRLLKQGRRPTMEEVAAEAMISRATAYRHFKNVESLVAEAPVDAAVAAIDTVFANDDSDDPENRVDVAEAAMHEVCFQNEAQLRVMLSNTVARDPSEASPPPRQNRRIPLIEAALAPARARFRKADYERLCLALAMIFGTESMIVFRDVLRRDPGTARRVKSWAVRALVRAALASSRPSAASK
jgi:AcrR family transcriptional regulator